MPRMKRNASLWLVVLLATLFATIPTLPQRAEADPSAQAETRKDVQRLRVENGAKADSVILDKATDGSIRSMRNASWQGSGGAAREVALGFAKSHPRALGMTDADASVLQVSREQQTAAGTRVTLQQTVQGLPVLNGRIDVLVRPDGTVTQVNNQSGALPTVVEGVRATPSAAAAKARADWKQGVTGLSDKRGLVVSVTGDTAPAMQVLRADAAMWNTGSAVRGVHEVVVEFARINAVASYVVDDATGAVLSRRLLTASLDGSGDVFDPNPLNFSPVQPNGTYTNATSDVTLATRMVNETLRSISQSGGNFILTGPYVTIAEIEAPTLAAAVPSVATANGFTFARSNAGFSATNAYRIIDEATRYIQGTLGFANVMNYALPVDVRGLNNADNSHYSQGGTAGQGYLAFGSGGVPDAEDCDIVLHEYAHAIQDNQSNGAYLYDGQSGAMGEGFSDFWAAAYTYGKSVANGFDAAAVGEWDATAYSNADPPALRRVDGNKVYPTDIVNQVHADGEIWSAALWTVFMQMSNDTQRNDFIKVVLQSHFLVPDNPTFNQAGHALVDANTQLVGSVGDMRPLIRASLLARGIFLNLPPGNLRMSNEYGGIRLLWVDQSDVESGYQVYRSVGAGKTASASGTLIATLAPNSTEYFDATVSPNTTYTYSVKAVDIDNPNSTSLSTTSIATVTASAASASGTTASGAVAGNVGGGGGGGGGGCFIATAAYGTPTESHVVSLRGFRDHVLMPTAPGRWFVATYYDYSPPMADWIRERPWARAAVRAGLAPVIFAVENPAMALWTVALLAMLAWRLRVSRRVVAVQSAKV